MDVVFRKIKCDTSLPIWVMENSFTFTCNAGEKCRFASGNVAHVSGKLVLNGFYNYADEDTKVALVGGLETLTDRYQVDQVVDLCETLLSQNDDDWVTAVGDDYTNGGNDDFAKNGDDDAVGYNDDFAKNGDDDAVGYNDDDDNAAEVDDYFNDDGNYDGDADDNNRLRLLDDCPADGVYSFSAYFGVPTGEWSATGWGATANLKVFAHDGSNLGSCKLSFKTRTTAFYIVPAKTVFLLSVIVTGIALFFVVFCLVKPGVHNRRCGSKSNVHSHRDGRYKCMADTDGEMMESRDKKRARKKSGTTTKKHGLNTGILA